MRAAKSEDRASVLVLREDGAPEASCGLSHPGGKGPCQSHCFREAEGGRSGEGVRSSSCNSLPSIPAADPAGPRAPPPQTSRTWAPHVSTCVWVRACIRVPLGACMRVDLQRAQRWMDLCVRMRESTRTRVSALFGAWEVCGHRLVVLRPHVLRPHLQARTDTGFCLGENLEFDVRIQ